MSNLTCVIDGCDRGDIQGGQLCRMHYHRKRRTGSAGESGARKRAARSEHCSIDGCLKPDSEGGLCSMHGARLRRHGDPHKVVAVSDRDYKRGHEHGNWVGNNGGYGAAHNRVRAGRGSAAEKQCVDCGLVASHWSYDHTDPKQKLAYDRSANPVPYSLDIVRYAPRCVPCHKTFDLARPDANKG